MNGGTVEQQATYNSFDNALNDIGLLGTSNDSRPAAYLNYILFDEHMQFYQHGHVQIGTAANGAHEKLTLNDIVAEKAGFVYVYISSESAATHWVYFDDMKVTLNESPVIQEDDYYPFGLTFNSYQRVTADKNKYLYNQGTGDKQFKTERITDLDLNLDMTKLRMYDYAIGRFVQVDPLADQGGQESMSSYQYAFNDPIKNNDPLGDCVPCGIELIKTLTKYSAILSKAEAPAQRLISGTSGHVPSEVNMDSQSKKIAKVTSTANDINTVAETGKEVTKEVVKDVGEVADKGGEAISDAGLIASPFTGGSSLVLVPVGETVSATGKVTKMSVNLAEGDDDAAAKEAVNLGFGLLTNTATKTAINQSKKVGNITNATEEATQTSVLGGLGSMLNKIVNYFTEDEQD
ncbi:hypothetical protein C900_01217 [Fulvivirga imtechensis AK7]|uniref:RHS repeat-associated core domain-containing protein n=1 Tax=Fulvivirga imtechensis AK7 TaxID=1237149 RepID=L8JIF8_9BACT|nr:hypothetical protein C900_01217 [Fulvivirga imtechensis AK7]